MLPLIPFAVGVVTGAVVLRLFKTRTSKEALEKVQSHLQGTTRSSPETVSSASERMRARLIAEEQPEAQQTRDLTPAATQRPVVEPPSDPSISVKE
ncbi:hypothetical protein [Azomonas macrocytogenes]|uniref:Uncharacterized membrane-anchored protein YhcB (DUF1043 family) n=1 Tax=Azomonas macrocytogenes TaxID=69962 RepID=A0A839T3A8_AZOMA|nr:hypothetical protein [Azomonas macrocytogenes]MBB3103160.1 uncharacterized membrane-anchored protein YhcB (DUF1043 family) [Azomonas macrocytogenes]